MSEETTPARRSGRKRKRNERYDESAWKKLEEAIVVSDEETTPIDAPESSGDEFEAAEAEEMEEGSEAEDDLSVDEGSAKDASAAEDDDEEDDDETPRRRVSGANIELLSERVPMSSLQRVLKKSAGKTGPRQRRVTALNGSNEVHTRGTVNATKHVGRDMTILHTFGGREEDITPIFEARDRWFDEITLPSRKANAKGKGGLAYSFYISETDRQKEATQGWDWFYDNGGRAALLKRQKEEALTAQEAAPYQIRTSPSIKFLLGPAASQELFDLDTGATINIDWAWNFASTTNRRQSTESNSNKPGRGWILNVGGPVHCLDWAPNQNGTHQYLAISTNTKREGNSYNSSRQALQSQTAPAFAPSDPSPSTIQIWEFPASPRTGHVMTTEALVKPRLHAVLCLDWDHIKQFRWCPCQRVDRFNAEEALELGLLALITNDGKLRVLNVNLPNNKSANIRQTIFLHISTAAFETRPPRTICTCLTWISPTTLAAGCADGYVGIWDLSSHLLSRSTSSNHSPDALPIFYQPFHTTYISCITSSYPSRPSLITTSSPAGQHRLTSLHNPTHDFILSPRTRVLATPTIWHDHTQHIFSADDSYTLKAFNIRNFGASVLMAHEDAGVTCLASSPVHSSLLLGRADGTVEIYGPVRRLLQRRHAGEHFRQVWWTHEWKRGRKGDDAAEKVNGAPAGLDGDTTMEVDGMESGETTTASSLPGNTPITRLLTGFGIQPLTDISVTVPASSTTKSTSKSTSKTKSKPKPKPASVRATSTGVIYSTIHEEQTAARAVAWNPNMCVGGWAAVGWGDGLVSVGDLCWD